MSKKENKEFYDRFPLRNMPFNYDVVKRTNTVFLIDLCSSVFKWTFENMTKEQNNILSSEIEKILFMNGVCSIVDVGKSDIELTAFFCNEFEPTYYYDVFKKRTINSPILAKTVNDSTSVLVWNNNTKSPCMPTIDIYAEQLTHIDLSIRNVAINMREPLNIPTASTNKMFSILTNYRKKLFRGDYEPIQDGGLVQCQFVKGEKIDSNSLSNLIESRKKLLLDFYNTFGIRTGIEKKGNVIEDEITSSEPMLRINIDDMLSLRECACEKIYELWGIKTTVERSVNNVCTESNIE